MLFTRNRWKYFTAMALIGDGMMAMVQPRREVSIWNAGPGPWRKMLRLLDEHPRLTRVLGGMEAAAAICWVMRHQSKESPR